MKWGHGGAPSSKKRGALIQKGPLDRHAQREDAVETHRVKASGRRGLVCRIYKSRNAQESWETSRSEEETRKDSPPPQVPTDTLDSDLWPLGGQDNKALLL